MKYNNNSTEIDCKETNSLKYYTLTTRSVQLYQMHNSQNENKS